MSNAVRALIAALVAAALVVGGVVLFGGDDDSPGAGSDTTSSPETTDSVVTTSPSASTTSAASAVGCSIVGSWILDSPAFAEAISAWTGTQFEHVSGTYTFVYAADGTFVANRDAWRLRSTTDGGAIVTENTSEETGTWEADGSIVVHTPVGGSDAVISVWLEVDGALLPLPGGQEIAMAGPGISGTGIIECPSANLLLMHVQTDEGPLTATLNRTG